jgi:ABC-type Zn uptake system ZnuABC Zn-binding protein ZnuA
MAGSGTVRAQSPLKVVTTTTILMDIAKNVVGDKVELASIVPPDGDAHDFEPSPNEVRLVADASLIFVNGAGFEGFIDKLIAESGTKATVVTVTHGIAIRPLGAHEDEHEGEKKEGDAHDDHAEGKEEHHDEVVGVSGIVDCAEHSHDEHQQEGNTHDHGFCDPHLWQDPINVIPYVLNMRDALIVADPANAEAYTTNAATYILALQELDAEVWAQVSTIPTQKRVLVTNHDALGYFAARYGFEVAAVVLTTSAAAEPSPQEVAAIIEEIKKLGVPAIFTENIGNDRLAQQIAAEAGVKVIQSLYTDALGAAGTPGETYLGMIRANAEAITSALVGSAS